MGLQASPTALEPNQGSLFSLETDGTIRVRKEGVNISNGLPWSADNKTMYYIDSTPRKVYAYNFDLKSGNISKSIIYSQL
jgi:gluconolactonase